MAWQGNCEGRGHGPVVACGLVCVDDGRLGKQGNDPSPLTPLTPPTPLTPLQTSPQFIADSAAVRTGCGLQEWDRGGVPREARGILDVHWPQALARNGRVAD